MKNNTNDLRDWKDPVFVTRFKRFQGKARVLTIQERTSPEAKVQRGIREHIQSLPDLLEDKLNGTLRKNVKVDVVTNLLSLVIEQNAEQASTLA